MFSIFFSWIRRRVTEAVFAGLADAAAELEAESENNTQAVEAFKARVLAVEKKPRDKKAA
jgi:hypothetical protein